MLHESAVALEEMPVDRAGPIHSLNLLTKAGTVLDFNALHSKSAIAQAMPMKHFISG
jgi:hypothetical protein